MVKFLFYRHIFSREFYFLNASLSKSEFWLESTDIPSCDLGNVQLTLVDSNMREVHLLNPIYITISVKIIEEDEE